MSYGDININHEAIAVYPSELEVSYHDLSSEETGRSLDGTAYKDLIAVKKDVNMTWVALTPTQSAALKTQIKSGIFITLDYPSFESATNATGTFYTGDMTFTAFQTLGGLRWRGSCPFVEQ